MDIAVTGGSGFVGRAVARDLSSRGDQVRLILRRPLSRDQIDAFPPGIRLAVTDFGNPASLANALAGADAVIHLIGIISECPPQTFEVVHRELTARCLDAARTAGVPRWVHMSALGTRPNARSRYHQTKWAGECLVRDSSLAWSILRPSLIYGAEDHFTNLFARMSALSPVIPILGPGHHLLQPVSVAAVASAFAQALHEPAARGATYDLCGPERIALAEVVRTILSVLGRRRLLLRIPWPLARAQAWCLEGIYRGLLRRPPPLNRDQILMLQEDNVGDGSAADRLFGLHHAPFRDGLDAYLGRHADAA